MSGFLNILLAQGPIGPPQPLFSNVQFLADWNGADEQTTYQTKDQNAWNLTPVTLAKLDNGQVKFGTTSTYLPGGNNDWIVPTNGQIDLASNDFCLEGWVYIELDPTTHTEQGNCLMSSWNVSFNVRQFSFTVNEAGGLEFGYSTNGTAETFIQSTTNGITHGGWHHIAVSRVFSTTTLRMFYDGDLLYENATTGGFAVFTTASGFADLQIGIMNNAFPQRRQYRGWIDDTRITVGEPVYTGGFTPPTTAFPTS